MSGERPGAGTTTVSASFFWAASGTGIQLLVQLLVLVVLARLLSPADFGLIATAMLVTQLATVFAEFGVAPAVVQRPELGPDTVGTAFWLSLALGGLFAAIVSLTSPLMATLFRLDGLVEVLGIYSIVFLLRGATAVQEALLQRDMEFRFLARADAWSFGVGYAGTAILAAYLGLSYWSLVLGHIAQAVIKAFLVVLKRPGLSRAPRSLASASGLVSFGVGQTLSRLGAYLGSQADSYVVATTLGVVPIGYYSRANQLITMPAFHLGQVLDRVLFPMFARQQQDRRSVAEAYSVALTAVTMVSVPIAVLSLFLAPAAIDIVLGEGWLPVATLVQVLALAVPGRLVHKISDPTARALGATYSRAWRQWTFVAIVVTGALLLSPYGVNAVAWAVVVASTLDAGLMAALCCRQTGLALGKAVATLWPGVRLGGALAILCALSQLLAHEVGTASLGALLIAGAATVLGCFLPLALAPRWLVGASGVMVMRKCMPRGTRSSWLSQTAR